MERVEKTISRNSLKRMSEKMFDDLVKAVVDVDKKIMYADAQMHSDMEKEMLEEGSLQEHLWGINLYLAVDGEQWIEFDSLINLRPSWRNRTQGVDDQEIKKQIIAIVSSLVKE